MENTIYIVAGIVALLVVARYFIVRRGRTLTGEARERAEELQSYLTSCVDDLRQVLAQKGQEPETIRREAYEILARMESGIQEGASMTSSRTIESRLTLPYSAAMRPNQSFKPTPLARLNSSR